MRPWFVLLTAGLLASCSSGGQPTTEPLAPAPVAPVAEHSVRPPAAEDQCGAQGLGYLVGKSKADIPVPVDTTLRRVACTTCPMTMDFSPRRLNILFDAESGVIKEIKCG